MYCATRWNVLPQPYWTFKYTRVFNILIDGTAA